LKRLEFKDLPGSKKKLIIQIISVKPFNGAVYLKADGVEPSGRVLGAGIMETCTASLFQVNLFLGNTSFYRTSPFFSKAFSSKMA